tara:strand:- start:172 stop:1689 length:1518 start_codon:yes stop_codon:yes gene_type:complete
MEVLDKFLKLYSYKFNKGYPDINDEQDILLLENILKKEFGIILENKELEDFFNKTNLFSDYGELKINPKGIKFSEIPPKGSISDTLRNEVYALIKKLSDDPKITDLTDYKRGEKGKGSSLGRAEFKFKGKQYLLPIKGTGKEDSTSTDVKEGLVSMFYASDIESPFNPENFDSRIEQLKGSFQKGIPGETKDVKDEILTFLGGVQNTTRFIKFLNQPLSSALTIKEVYPNQKLIRTGDFDDIRTRATQITGYPSDKWCPGDLYVEISSPGDVKNIEGIETLNDLFNDSWGENDKPLVAVSLKQEAAQGGKAKAMLQQFTKVKDDYNLTKDERNYTPDQYREGIEELRPKIQSLVASNDNIIYNFTDGELKDDQTRGKYAALKSIEFLFRSFPNQKVDDAVVALAGFALSLTGVNPTFFKLTGKSSGAPASVETFKRGSAVELFGIDGKYEPIEIIDTPTFGGLKLDFMVEKAGEIHTVLLNARNNGTTQGTLEIQKIEQVSNQVD